MPYGEQPAHDNAAIEKVKARAGTGAVFEGEVLRVAIPGVGFEEARGMGGAIEVGFVAGDGIEIHERAGGVAGNLGGNGEVRAVSQR